MAKTAKWTEEGPKYGICELCDYGMQCSLDAKCLWFFVRSKTFLKNLRGIRGGRRPTSIESPPAPPPHPVDD